jgi:hypothetical protein
MAKPYQSPMRRARMAGKSVMQEDAPPDQPQEPAANPAADISAFIPKDFFGDMPPKQGDSITVMVKAIDPDTGEVEVTKGDSETDNQNSPMEEMDSRFPPDENEGT